jgi:thioredoxin-related protein
MKTMFLLLLASLTVATPIWLTNFDDAQKIAVAKHRLILLNFSGSDWCGPCMRLKKEIFNSPEFCAFADTSLVLVNADFPRSSKNQLPADQVARNEALAAKYNAEGDFPLTVLLTADGKVLYTWEGLPSDGTTHFIQQIKQQVDAYK